MDERNLRQIDQLQSDESGGKNHSDRGAKLSIILPAYNEEENIESTVAEVWRVAADLFLDFEIVIVDDGSRDATLAAALRSAQSWNNVIVIGCAENRGKGQALKAGALRCSGDYVAFLDSDLDIHPSELKALIDTMASGSSDAVVGSKHHPDSIVQNYPSKRRLFSLAYYQIVRAFFGLPIRDTQTGIKVFRKDLLLDVLPRLLAKRYAFDLELLAVAHRRKYRISDAPIHVVFRRSFGRIRTRDAWSTLGDTAAIFYRMYLRGYYERPHSIVEENEAYKVHARGLLAAGSAQ